MTSLTFHDFEARFWRSKKVIGVGAFGKVEEIVEKRTGKKFALKMINCKNTDQLSKSIQEILVLFNIRHEYIIQMIHYFIQGGNMNSGYCIGVIMEMGMYNFEMELSKRRTERNYISEKKMYFYFQSLIKAFSHLQDHSIAHRDIKPENLIFCGKSYKVTDFGLATIFSETTRSIAGTPEYHSPEIRKSYKMRDFKQIDYLKSDVFSFGLTFMEAALLIDVKTINSSFTQNSMYSFLSILSKSNMYASWFVEILSLMTNFDETVRPDFKTLSKFLENLGSPLIFTSPFEEFEDKNVTHREGNKRRFSLPSKQNIEEESKLDVNSITRDNFQSNMDFEYSRKEQLQREKKILATTFPCLYSVTAADFSFKYNLLFLGNEEGKLEGFHVNGEKCQKLLEHEIIKYEKISCIRVNEDNLVLGYGKGNVSLFNISKNIITNEIDIKMIYLELHPHIKTVTDIMVPNSIILTSSTDCTIKQYQIQISENKILYQHTYRTNPVSPIYKLEVIPNSNYFVAGGGDGTLIMVDYFSFEVIRNIKNAHSDWIWGLKSLNEDYFISTGGDKRLLLWKINPYLTQNEIFNSLEWSNSIELDIEPSTLLFAHQSSIYALKIDINQSKVKPQFDPIIGLGITEMEIEQSGNPILYFFHISPNKVLLIKGNGQIEIFS